MENGFNTTKENRRIAAAASGDKAAFGEIVTEYEKLVWGTIRTKIKNEEDALDLSQEVFLKIWRSIGSYRGDCRFSTWVYRIASNTALDFLRRAPKNANESLDSRTDAEGEEKAFEVADESLSASPERSLEQAETTAAVRQAIASLSEDQRTVVLLRDIEGYTYEEIAGMLSVEIGTVKSRLNRARLHLREKLSHLRDRI